MGLELLVVALLGLAAYLIGSVPPGYYLVWLLKRVDLREVGSRNVGTLNTYNQVGFWGAGLVLALDIGKGALALLLPGWVGAPEWGVYVTGALVIAGHNWSVLLRFRAGKGAAPLIGVGLAFVPYPALISLIPGAITVILSRNAVLGLAVGYICLNLLVLAAALTELEQWLGVPVNYGISHFAFCLALTLLVAVTYGVANRAQFGAAIRHRSWRELL